MKSLKSSTLRKRSQNQLRTLVMDKPFDYTLETVQEAVKILNRRLAKEEKPETLVQIHNGLVAQFKARFDEDSFWEAAVHPESAGTYFLIPLEKEEECEKAIEDSIKALKSEKTEVTVNVNVAATEKVTEEEKPQPKKKQQKAKETKKAATEHGANLGKTYRMVGQRQVELIFEDGTKIERGMPIGFQLKGEDQVGEFRHVLYNKNNAPNGYAVIKWEGKIIERVLSRVTPVKAQPKKKAAKK
jgi:hypothetical protein